MVAAGSAVLPAYIYLYVRSRNENGHSSQACKHGCGSVSSDRCACDDLMRRSGIGFFTRLVFRVRKKSTSDFFADGCSGFEYVRLSQAGDVLARIGLAETGLGSRGKCGGIGRHQRARWWTVTSAAADQDCARFIAKLDTPLVVKAWVGYSFGDTVLLCKWHGERRKREGSDDGRKYVCVPWPVRNSVVYRVPFPPKRRQRR